MTMNRLLLIAGLLISSFGSAGRASAQILPALPEGTWRFLNTCWGDYDVGGGKMCAVYRQTTISNGVQSSCGSGTNRLTVQCFHSDPVQNVGSGTGTEPAFPSLAAPEVAMAVDESGNPWVLAADHNIYYGLNGTWHMWRSLTANVNNQCANQIAVQGGTVMVKSCDSNVYAYIGSVWVLQQVGISELSVGANPYTQDGTGAFWAYSQGSTDFIANTQTLTFAPVNTKSHGAAVNVPTDCYYVSSAYTCASVNLVYAVHQGGGELSFIGQYPQGNQECTAAGCVSNPAPVCVTTHADNNSPTGLSDWYTPPWFASFTVYARDFSAFDLVGYQQIDRYFDFAGWPRMNVQPSQYRDEAGAGPQVCENLAPPTVGTSNEALDGPAVVKLREGSKFGHLGGPHSPGFKDVRWLINSFAEVWSYETYN
jgi:hypothetical protein